MGLLAGFLPGVGEAEVEALALELPAGALFGWFVER